LHIKCEEQTVSGIVADAYHFDLKPMSTEALEHAPVPALFNRWRDLGRATPTAGNRPLG
jgi:hypothetical protein